MRSAVHGFAARSGQLPAPEAALHLFKVSGELPLLTAFCGCFLAGYLPGILLGRDTALAVGTELAAWCADTSRYTDGTGEFISRVAAAFLQLTLIAGCGFCVFGLFFLFANFFFRGVFMGFCAASVYGSGGTKALAQYWLLSCLPDLLILLLGLLLAVYAAKPAGTLYHSVVGTIQPGRHAGVATRKLLIRYLFAVLLAIPACAVCSGLSALLATALF